MVASCSSPTPYWGLISFLTDQNWKLDLQPLSTGPCPSLAEHSVYSVRGDTAHTLSTSGWVQFDSSTQPLQAAVFSIWSLISQINGSLAHKIHANQGILSIGQVWSTDLQTGKIFTHWLTSASLQSPTSWFLSLRSVLINKVVPSTNKLLTSTFSLKVIILSLPSLDNRLLSLLSSYLDVFLVTF